MAYVAEKKPAYRLLPVPGVEEREAVRRHVREALRVDALPASVASAKTLLVWRKGHQSSALDALKEEMARRKP